MENSKMAWQYYFLKNSQSESLFIWKSKFFIEWTSPPPLKLPLTFSCFFPHFRMWIFLDFYIFSLKYHSSLFFQRSKGFLSRNLFSLWKKSLSNFRTGSIDLSGLSFLFWDIESWSGDARSAKKNPHLRWGFFKGFLPCLFRRQF